MTINKNWDDKYVKTSWLFCSIETFKELWRLNVINTKIEEIFKFYEELFARRIQEKIQLYSY